jgi:DNA adenine methylase
MYKALQGGWATPSQVTKEDYYACKARADLKDPLTGFIGYCCSYGGKFWGGYAAANPKNPHGYARNGANSLARTFANCPSSTVIFNHGSYETLDFGKRSLIYCDPPYEGTTGYDATGAFNHDAFWEWCRKRKAAGATVLISSYKARPDFKVVFQVTKKTTLGKIEDSQECLFEPQ